MSTPPQFWLEIIIYQITSASISFVASALIVSFIALNGLSTPFRRIIFGLSISDMCQSFGILAGPFLAPSTTPQALWGIGNELTCRVDGFLNHLGMTAVPMYTVFLCVYYVCKLKNRMTNAQFTHRIEKKVHAAIIFINLGLYLPSLGMNIMNPNYLGNVCGPAFVPTGCRQNPELYGECENSSDKTVKFYLMISAAAVPILSLLGIIVCMGLIFWHALWRERMFGNTDATTTSTTTGTENHVAATSHHGIPSTFVRGSVIQNSNLRGSRSIGASMVASSTGEIMMSNVSTHSSTDVNILSSDASKGNSISDSMNCNIRHNNPPQAQVEHHYQPANPSTNGGGESITTPRASGGDAESRDTDTTCADADMLFRLYKKELISQVCCYSMVFCLSYLPYIVVAIILQTPYRVSNNGLRALFILYPLAGFFNIIVYTRWNVRSWKRRHPQCSWLRSFWLVLKAGGDLPSKNDKDHEDGRRGDLSNEDDSCPRLKNRPVSMMSSEPFGAVVARKAVPIKERADVQACSVEAMGEYHLSYLEQGDLVSTSEVRVHVDDLVSTSLGQVSEKVTSTFKEGDIRYRPESQWFYMKGSNSGSIVTQSSRFVDATTSNASTIQHANRGGVDHSNLVSFPDDVSLTGLNSCESEVCAVSL